MALEQFTPDELSKLTRANDVWQQAVRNERSIQRRTEIATVLIEQLLAGVPAATIMRLLSRGITITEIILETK